MDWFINLKRVVRPPYLPKVLYAFLGILISVSFLLAIDAFQYMKRHNLYVNNIYKYLVSYWETFWLKFYDAPWLLNHDYVLDLTPEIGVYSARLNSTHKSLQVHVYIGTSKQPILYHNLSMMNLNDYTLVTNLHSVAHISFAVVRIDLRGHKDFKFIPRYVFEKARGVIVCMPYDKRDLTTSFLKSHGFEVDVRQSGRHGLLICQAKRI